MRKKQDMVELSFRIPADGWKDLTALLMALAGSVAPTARQAAPTEERMVESGEVNAGFQEETFWRLAKQEQMTAQAWESEQRTAEQPLYRVEAQASAPLSAPEPASYAQVRERIAEPSESAEKNEEKQIDWESRWERDCRRYDGGFSLK